MIFRQDSRFLRAAGGADDGEGDAAEKDVGGPHQQVDRAGPALGQLVRRGRVFRGAGRLAARASRRRSSESKEEKEH